MATGNASKGSKGGGTASPATHDEDEDLMTKRVRHFRSWVNSRKSKKAAIPPADMLCKYPNSPKPPAR
jgi:hypothetical protein